MAERYRSHPYGRDVVGEKEATLQRQVRKKKSNVYGPDVLGDRPQDPPRIPVTTAPAPRRRPPAPRDPELPLGTQAKPEDAGISVEDLTKLLKDEPWLLDRQIDAEHQRVEGPRKGALRLFIRLEAGRAGGPRKTVMQLLEGSLRKA